MPKISKGGTLKIQQEVKRIKPQKWEEDQPYLFETKRRKSKPIVAKHKAKRMETQAYAAFFLPFRRVMVLFLNPNTPKFKVIYLLFIFIFFLVLRQRVSA